jgi:hypothetical protein
MENPLLPSIFGVFNCRCGRVVSIDGNIYILLIFDFDAPSLSQGLRKKKEKKDGC